MTTKRFPRRTPTTACLALALTALLLASGASLLAGAPVAADVTQARQIYEAELTKNRAGSATGLRQSIDYLGDEEGDKPHAVAEVIFKLPRGTRIDTSVVPHCTATEAEFQAEGADACPPETRVGDGSLSADTGNELGPEPRIIETEVTFFNNDRELILFAESTNTPAPVRVASRIEVRRRKFISTVPPLPGTPPPDPFLALDEVSNDLERLKTEKGAYIRAPQRCQRGVWNLRAKFTYRDGMVEKAKSQMPCRRAQDHNRN